MINLKKITILIIMLGAMPGCEMMNSSYDCPLADGASCMSLHAMDKAVSQGLYPKEEENNNNNENDIYVVHKDLMPGTYPKRTKDMVAKIWLAPYEDNYGNYHEQSNIYIVIESSTWVGSPVKSPNMEQTT